MAETDVRQQGLNSKRYLNDKYKGYKRRFHPRDYWSCITHGIGIFFGIIATIYMAIEKSKSAEDAMFPYVAFGLSITALYATSSFYHYYNGPSEKLVRIRKLDHSIIFVLIAGSYTPILAKTLTGTHEVIFISVMWTLALLGCIMKVFWLNAPRRLYTSLYILMGWAILFSPKALFSMNTVSFWLLVAGGLSYTVGGVIYAIKKPNITEEFGFHEIFHCFILLGTILQFFSIGVFL